MVKIELVLSIYELWTGLFYLCKIFNSFRSLMRQTALQYEICYICMCFYNVKIFMGLITEFVFFYQKHFESLTTDLLDSLIQFIQFFSILFIVLWCKPYSESKLFYSFMNIWNLNLLIDRFNFFFVLPQTLQFFDKCHIKSAFRYDYIFMHFWNRNGLLGQYCCNAKNIIKNPLLRNILYCYVIQEN